MKKLFSIKECKSIEKDLISKENLSEDDLIKKVGSFVFENTIKYIKDKRVLFLVGKGNNGSDALEVALKAKKVAKDIKILKLFDNGNDENEKRSALFSTCDFVNKIDEEYDTIFDGIFGFGFHGKVGDEIVDVIKKVNLSSSFVISLDMPSNFLIKADITFTFLTLKYELFLPENRSYVGDIIYYDLGLYEKIERSSSLYLLEDDDYNAKEFKSEDYKNKRGHILSIGGSVKYPGSIILSSLSSIHSGGGLCTLVSNKRVRDLALSRDPSLMVCGYSKIKGIKYSSALIGPGVNRRCKKELKSLIKSGKSFVIDSGALSYIKGMKFSYRAVLTPHLGEEKRLLSLLSVKSSDIINEIKEISKITESIVVLKTSVVYITDGESVYIYDGENPSLGTAGSGDVLSGIIASFLSIENPLSSSIDGVILHQKAGRVCKEKYGYYTALNLVNEIGKLR